MQKGPHFKSIALAVIFPDSSLLLSVIGAKSTPREYPGEIYSDLVEIPLSEGSEDEFDQRKILVLNFLQACSVSNDSNFNSNIDICDLGVYISPNWGCCAIFTKYYMCIMLKIEHLSMTIPQGYSKITFEEALKNYHKMQLISPPTIGFIRSLSGFSNTVDSTSVNPIGPRVARYFHAMSHEQEIGYTGSSNRYEIAPHFEMVPIASNTLFPFNTTNLVMITNDEATMVVDPGASPAGKPHLEAVLQRLSPSNLLIFITHHHHDHIEALDVIEAMYPSAKVIGHPFSLDRINTTLEKVIVCANDEDQYYFVGSHQIEIISLPGHTRGHLALFDKASGIIVAGDHIVGYGSSVLDPEGGGNMIMYLRSTEKLKQLHSQFLLPCHGPPVIAKSKLLLEEYINHRLHREKLILDAWNGGEQNLDGIVKSVYSDTPTKLWNVAKRNVLLHLEKLSEEHTIILNQEISEALEKFHKETKP